ncbi:MAG: hypothetical protein AB7T49_09220 [Oligoflexales bacterium]
MKFAGDHTHFQFALVLSVTFLLANCSSDTGFNGKTSKESSDASKEETASPADQAPPVVADQKELPEEFDKSCGEEMGLTNVNLLSKALQNGQDPQTIRYEVSYVDCSGKPWPITGEILFDLNVQPYEGYEAGLAFEIEDPTSGAVITAGTMVIVPGQDLFGKVGAGYSHVKTQPLTTTFSLPILIFEVNISGKTLLPAGFDPDDDRPDFFDLQSFLRLGSAKPVAETIRVQN